MTTDRAYRPALTHEEAVAELDRGAGSQFDPAIVEAFSRAQGCHTDWRVDIQVRSSDGARRRSGWALAMMDGLVAMLAQFSPEQWVAALWFALAIALLDRFDISLPRGDSIGVSGALVAAGTMVAELFPMTVFSLLALCVAHIGRFRQTNSHFRSASSRAWRPYLLLWGLAPLWSGASTSSLRVVWLVALPTLYLCAEVFAAQAYMALESGRPLHRLLVGNYQRQGPLVAAQVSASVLATITYPDMQAWSLVLVVALLLLMRQSLALLLDIRETYRTTVEVLVEVAEHQDARRRGHGERTAHIAREIAMRMGLSATDVERVSYASLLHDIDALAEQTEVSASATGQSAQVFAGTAFFDDVLPVLRLCDGAGVDGDYIDADT